MSTKERSLIPSLAREMGDTDASNYYYTIDQLFSAINSGLEDFNLEVPDQQYTVIGSADAAYFSPDPSEEDKRLIILYAALALTRGEIQKSARTALVHTNPAGRTDLTNIPKALSDQADRIEKKIKDIFANRSRQLVEKGLDEAGIELKGKPTEAAEGLGITIIEKTV